MDREIILLQLYTIKQAVDALIVMIAKEGSGPAEEGSGSCPECKKGQLIDTTVMGGPKTFVCNNCDFKTEDK